MYNEVHKAITVRHRKICSLKIQYLELLIASIATKPYLSKVS